MAGCAVRTTKNNGNYARIARRLNNMGTEKCRLCGDEPGTILWVVNIIRSPDIFMMTICNKCKNILDEIDAKHKKDGSRKRMIAQRKKRENRL